MRKALGITPLSIFLSFVDAVCIALGLWLSGVVRLALPFGQELGAGGATCRLRRAGCPRRSSG